ncbi:MAG: permease prefix domain 2-containing transporter [Chryseolinea sp.]
MNKNPQASPPRIFQNFFHWYCDPKLHSFLEGDLLEVHDRRIKSSGKRKADMLFIIDVFLLFRPGIIRPIHSKININNHYCPTKILKG